MWLLSERLPLAFLLLEASIMTTPMHSWLWQNITVVSVSKFFGLCRSGLQAPNVSGYHQTSLLILMLVQHFIPCFLSGLHVMWKIGYAPGRQYEGQGWYKTAWNARSSVIELQRAAESSETICTAETNASANYSLPVTASHPPQSNNCNFAACSTPLEMRAKDFSKHFWILLLFSFRCLVFLLAKLSMLISGLPLV